MKITILLLVLITLQGSYFQARKLKRSSLCGRKLHCHEINKCEKTKNLILNSSSITFKLIEESEKLNVNSCLKLLEHKFYYPIIYWIQISDLVYIIRHHIRYHLDSGKHHNFIGNLEKMISLIDKNLNEKTEEELFYYAGESQHFFIDEIYYSESFKKLTYNKEDIPFVKDYSTNHNYSMDYPKIIVFKKGLTVLGKKIDQQNFVIAKQYFKVSDIDINEINNISFRFVTMEKVDKPESDDIYCF